MAADASFSTVMLSMSSGLSFWNSVVSLRTTPSITIIGVPMPRTLMLVEKLPGIPLV